MTATAWDRNGSCWHDGPDRCPGCRHCIDNYTDPEPDHSPLPAWILAQADPSARPWPEVELEKRQKESR